MLPVMVNILLIDMFILPPDYGPSLPAAIIFVSLIMLLWRDSQILIQAILATQMPEPIASRKLHFWIRAAIVTTVLAMTTLGVLTMRR